MRTLLFLAAFVLFAPRALSQAGAQVERKDSVTVSAGISKEQLALEDRLSQMVSRGDELLRKGTYSDAVRAYQDALTLVQNQPLLAEQEVRIEKKLAGTFIRDNRPNDAIPIYSKLLDARKQDCDAKSEKPWDCADAEYEFGRAKMYAGDFAGALVLLTDADTQYLRAEQLNNDSHEFAMIQLKNQGDVKILTAAALFRTGKGADAITLAEKAIDQLRRVQSDETINVGIRSDAARLLQQAQANLSQLKSAR
jgi:tetratricopeptide (TPR) repeat protein